MWLYCYRERARQEKRKTVLLRYTLNASSFVKLDYPYKFSDNSDNIDQTRLSNNAKATQTSAFLLSISVFA